MAMVVSSITFTNPRHAGEGYQQYRTGHCLNESMFADAPGYHHVARAIKQALDPNDILAPGRYGLGSTSPH